MDARLLSAEFASPLTEVEVSALDALSEPLSQSVDGSVDAFATPDSPLLMARGSPVEMPAQCWGESARAEEGARDGEEGARDGEEVRCDACAGTDCAEGNELLLCDGVGCDVCLHLRCLEPPLEQALGKPV
eukprot:5890516-Pleurochrysis_carterae.AAC.1